MSLTSVPQPYLGMWRRTLLEQVGFLDTTTLVLWLQTEQYHADIRIPANRPMFDSVNQLEDCSDNQLTWLATQQGFTGITQINGNIAQWIRDHDFQPSNGQRDIGQMKFETDEMLVETGLDANYLERWERVANTKFNFRVKQLFGENRRMQKVPARLLIANSAFAYVRPRDTQLPNANSLIEAIDKIQPNKETLLDWLDFEISFGELIDEDHGYITRSTLPFRERKNIKFSEC